MEKSILTIDRVHGPMDIFARMTKKRIASVDEAVEALGGVSSTADLYGVILSEVEDWIASGRFPKGHHLRIYLDLQERGRRVDLVGVFGMSPRRKRDQSTTDRRVASVI